MTGSVIWERKIGKHFTLQEYEFTPMNCIVIYQGLEKDYIRKFWFNGWGTDRELITAEQCLVVSACLNYENADSSVCSFYKNYLHYSALFEDEIGLNK